MRTAPCAKPRHPEPGRPDRRRHLGAAQGQGRVPAGPAQLQPRAHAHLRPRPALDPAPARARARADLLAAPAPHAGRLHARPRGEHVRHGPAPREVPLARVELRRPDPAPRRRAPDDRRRVPRPRAADHDAGVSPRAHHRVGRGDVRGGGRGARRTGVPARRSTYTSGRGTWRCGSRCALSSGSTRTTAAAARRRPSTSSGRSPTTASSTRLPPASRARIAVAEDAPLAEDPRRDPLRGDPPAPVVTGRRLVRHPRPAARGDRRGRLEALRPGGARPGDHADVRRARHDDLDGVVSPLRARSAPRASSRSSPRSRTRCSAARRPTR